MAEKSSGTVFGENDRLWHAKLLCELDQELTQVNVKHLKHLKQMIKMTGKVPKKFLEDADDFFAIWVLLENESLLDVGEYDVLDEIFGMMKMEKLSFLIKTHGMRIKEFRERKKGVMTKPDSLVKDVWTQTQTIPISIEESDGSNEDEPFCIK